MSEVIAGRIQLHEAIGAGAMGTVWRATDLRSGDVVAAKVMRQSDAADLLRFVRESSLEVHGPHLLTPLGWVGEDGRVAFTMPLCSGGSVADLIGDYGSLPPLLVAEVLRQMAQALIVVHDAGLVHRDVKPANVLLDPTGQARPTAYLADFGLAVAVDGPRLTAQATSVGTVGYRAPECADGGRLDPRSDLYALGQVGREMVLGAHPDDIEAGKQLDIGSSASATLSTLLTRMTEADPDDRPQSAREVLAALHTPSLAWEDTAMADVEVLTHVEVEATTAPMVLGGTGRQGRGVRRDPITMGLIVLALVALVVFMWAILQIT